MWSIEAAIARHERVVMEAEGGAASSGAAPAAVESQSHGSAAGRETSSKKAAAAAATMKVVAAVDASEESLHALSWALDNIVVLHPGASVVVVHAQHRVDHFVYPVAAHAVSYAPTTALDTMRKTQEENSRKVLSRALEICSQKQVSATAAVVEGDAKEAICQAVEDMQADLLVLGSRGLGMIKRALLGSVSDYLAHHACCPVLVVKPPKAHGK